jgi:dUTP pyrophosphatase
MAEEKNNCSVQHIPVRFKKLHADAQIPAYGRPGDAGLDLYAVDDMTLVPHEQRIVKTGIAMAIPPGTVALIWDRSGLAAKQGVTVLGGVIDHTYRGEIGVVLMNVSARPYDVKKGDRVAQLLIQPVFTADISVVDDLEETHRGDGAWGSSGR